MNNNKMYYVKKNGKSVTVLLKDVNMTNSKYLVEQYKNGDQVSQFGAGELLIGFREVKEMTTEIIKCCDELGFKGINPAKIIELNEEEKYPIFKFKRDKNNQATNIMQVTINHRGDNKKEFFKVLVGQDDNGQMIFEPYKNTDDIWRNLWNVELEIRPYVDRSGNSTFFTICHRIVYAKQRDNLMNSGNDCAFAEFFGGKANVPTDEKASVIPTNETIDF